MTTGAELTAIGFGIAASITWGTSDFSGGIAAKRAHIFAVMTGSYAMGLVLLIALALARSEPLPAVTDVVWATLAGLAGAAGLTAQYRALAVGKMGIAAPVAAVLGASIPVAFSAVIEGVPGVIQLAGFGLALIGVWLIARPQNRSGGAGDTPQNTARISHEGKRSGIGLAVFAGMGFGLFFILIDRVSDHAVFWPLVAARGASFWYCLP